MPRKTCYASVCRVQELQRLSVAKNFYQSLRYGRMAQHHQLSYQRWDQQLLPDQQQNFLSPPAGPPFTQLLGHPEASLQISSLCKAFQVFFLMQSPATVFVCALLEYC